jgi:hypothetical protein
MKILTLDEAKKNPLECEEFQLKNWINTLSEYIKKDTAMKIKKGALSGQNICPSCKELMALGVKNYCDKCGQRIIE